MQGHYIVCGLGRIGMGVLKYLRATGRPIVAVDCGCEPDRPGLEGVTVVSGDCRRAEALERAGVAGAAGVLILTSDDLLNLSTALLVHQLNPGARVVIRMFHPQLLPRLGPAARQITALSTSALAAPVLSLIARTGGALGGFALPAGGQRQVEEVVVGGGSSLRGTKLKEVPQHGEVAVVAHKPCGGDYRFQGEFDPGAVLGPGDGVVVCGDPAAVGRLRAGGTDPPEPELLLAGVLVRYWRVAARTAARVDLSVKVCTALLLAVLLVSTLVFRGALGGVGLADAFYYTVNLTTSSGEMGLAGGEPPAWLKVYVGFLRLAGAALVAAFTAILTNYLVRAQLAGAFAVRRIPESGHVVVCGLGNVGFRVVQDLVERGELAVVIERDQGNPFLSSARRLGVPVIVGDAKVGDILKEAHAAAAKGVVVVTDNDLANLEIGLLVRDLNPAQRVVLRLGDDDLARTLREGADVRLALSVPDLVAPAFVSPLVGDRVRSVFYVGGRLLAAVDLPVSADFLDGMTVKALSVDYRLQPVHLRLADGLDNPRLWLATLGAGDVLTVIIDLESLQRLLHREPVPADCGVEVVSVPFPARDYVAQLLRSRRGLSPEQAEAGAAAPPVRLADGLTRGQAEDLLYWLERERVSARVVPAGGAATVPGA